MATKEEKRQEYLAVYGAYVALQVKERMDRGLGSPDYEDMRHFVEEAHSVAEMAEQSQDWEPDEDNFEDEDDEEL